ncbi:MAG: DUF6527 family protein [Archangium sp.]|nr:DUF6527 family protein [Archangium sp.]
MKLNRLADGTVLYRCPCGDTHAINAKTWTISGTEERPTFAPSVLIRSGHHVPRDPGAPESCWCTYAKEHPEEKLPFGCYLCHSFVRDGMVQFLGDCTHPLAGQTVPLGDWS